MARFDQGHHVAHKKRQKEDPFFYLAILVGVACVLTGLASQLGLWGFDVTGEQIAILSALFLGSMILSWIVQKFQRRK